MWLGPALNQSAIPYDVFDENLSSTSHEEDLNVPTSVFSTPVDTTADSMEIWVVTTDAFAMGMASTPTCDTANVYDFEQHIYGCMDSNAYNYDPNVTHVGYSSSNTSSPCGTCTYNPSHPVNNGDVHIDGMATITVDSGGSGVGGIDVEFIGFNWATDYDLTISYSGSGSFTTQSLTNILFTNPIGTTIYSSTLTGLDAGLYTFEFKSFRTHTQHDGTVVDTQCIIPISIEVPLG
jgi:hypothetical protein